MWVARYIMARIGEQYGVDVECIASQSLAATISRSTGTAPACHGISPPSTSARWVQKYFEALMARLPKHIDEHIAGTDRTTICASRPPRTQSIDKFNYALSGSRRLCPHAGQLHQERIPRLPGDRRPEFSRRSVPGRRSHPQDHTRRFHHLKRVSLNFVSRSAYPAKGWRFFLVSVRLPPAPLVLPAGQASKNVCVGAP